MNSRSASMSFAYSCRRCKWTDVTGMRVVYRRCLTSHRASCVVCLIDRHITWSKWHSSGLVRDASTESSAVIVGYFEAERSSYRKLYQCFYYRQTCWAYIGHLNWAEIVQNIFSKIEHKLLLPAVTFSHSKFQKCLQTRPGELSLLSEAERGDEVLHDWMGWCLWVQAVRNGCTTMPSACMPFSCHD